MPGHVYIMTNKRYGTLYTGVTADLSKRVWEHKTSLVPAFTSRYRLYRLVYYEEHEDIRDAIEREKRIKRWRRTWKIELIESINPTWQDLSDGF